MLHTWYVGDTRPDTVRRRSTASAHTTDLPLEDEYPDISGICTARVRTAAASAARQHCQWRHSCYTCAEACSCVGVLVPSFFVNDPTHKCMQNPAFHVPCVGMSFSLSCPTNTFLLCTNKCCFTSRLKRYCFSCGPCEGNSAQALRSKFCSASTDYSPQTLLQLLTEQSNPSRGRLRRDQVDT